MKSVKLVGKCSRDFSEKFSLGNYEQLKQLIEPNRTNFFFRNALLLHDNFAAP